MVVGWRGRWLCACGGVDDRCEAEVGGGRGDVGVDEDAVGVCVGGGEAKGVMWMLCGGAVWCTDRTMRTSGSVSGEVLV